MFISEEIFLEVISFCICIGGLKSMDSNFEERSDISYFLLQINNLEIF